MTHSQSIGPVTIPFTNSQVAAIKHSRELCLVLVFVHLGNLAMLGTDAASSPATVTGEQQMAPVVAAGENSASALVSDLVQQSFSPAVDIPNFLFLCVTLYSMSLHFQLKIHFRDVLFSCS